MKLKGHSLDHLIALKSARTSNAHVTHAMNRLAFAGRGVLFLTVALSAYTVAASSDKVSAVQKELAVNGASIAGGIAGGALAAFGAASLW